MIALNSTENLSVAPAPWTLQAESWLFLGYHSNSQIHQIQSEPLKSQENLVLSANARIEQAAGLFPGSYHPLEDLPDVLRVGEKPERLKRDQFEGGLCGWILFRYSESPVGPYDELIYVAGSFESPETSTTGLRITNIVVSSEASTLSGRSNWNIPKHLAEFKWSDPVYSENFSEPQSLEVFHPAASPLNSTDPFFSTSFEPTLSTIIPPIISSIIPSFPLNTKFPILEELLNLIQPNLLPSGLYANQTFKRIQVGTEDGVYRATAPTFKGSFELASSSPNLRKEGKDASYGDGRSFPVGSNMLGVGVHFKHVEVEFPLSEEYAVGGGKK